MLEDSLTELAERGWALGYLRQSGHGWEAQLIRPGEVSWACADEPAEAIEAALARVPDPAVALPYTTANLPKANILALLGLVKPIRRRI